ncbi:hypothetical protein CK203_001779 [Vitis vinifera]|uniref:Uncharacterized protein n=1 Tax=Vitis vinifera TaxID=29760 RepID=A0A438KIY6_VITVI|nr:hypothetical protein CK203_001779 [Vitis vinifera]
MATGDCNKEFSTDYILLEPEKLNFYELIRILFPGDIEKRKFVDCLEGAESNFERRWIIFISISAQKFLQFVAKPLSWFGSAFETGLNLSSTNGGFGMLLLNCLRAQTSWFFLNNCIHILYFKHIQGQGGNIQWPDKTSPTFSSFNGHLDKRVELDESIKPGDSKYYAALTMMSSKISYENKAFIKTTVEDEWKMEFLGSFDFWNDYQDKATTQAFILHDKTVDSDTIIVTFRGTETFDADAWCTDFDISCDWSQLRGGTGNPLSGNFGIARGDMDVGETAGRLYIWTTRVGDPKFGEFTTEQLKEHNIPYFRFVYGNDLVPRLPYDNKALMFKHFGTCLYYNSFYEGKIVAEEPNKNYFSPLMAIPKTMNAVWELIRSFIIGHSKGKDYTEGWFLRAFRVLGLIVPGVSAHGPQDYVNATRLGSSALFLPHQIPTE